jgi:hypothetical protein
MILKKLILMLATSISLTSALIAGSDRGDRLIGEAGGAAALPGVAGPAGAPGIAGAAGAQGIQGIPGIPSAPGVLDFSDFYALMPGDTATIGTNVAVQFPQVGPTNGSIIALDAPATQFQLPTIGTYLIKFQASIDEAGPGSAQLELRLNGSPLPDSVVGRDTGTSQIIGTSLVTTTSPNAVLEVINPGGTALTLTPIAGGTHSVSAHLVIIRIQ